jgi:ribosomal protein S27AE
MEDKQKNIEIISSEEGLQCDNTECDWTSSAIKEEDMVNWIDKPCPKCGQNVLTQHDYNLHSKLLKAIDFVNTLSDEQINSLTEIYSFAQLEDLLNDPSEVAKLFKDGEFNVSVSMHEKIKIDVNEIKDKE